MDALWKARADLRTLEDERPWQVEKVKRAKLSLLATAPKVATLIDEVEALQVQLADKAYSLAWLVSRDIVSTKSNGGEQSRISIVAGLLEHSYVALGGHQQKPCQELRSGLTCCRPWTTRTRRCRDRRAIPAGRVVEARIPWDGAALPRSDSGGRPEDAGYDRRNLLAPAAAPGPRIDAATWCVG